ncbi:MULTISPECIES: hypothetical protein [Chryseobacterium]|uniref:Uncharacterized protein n=1 Tax=Candidatus Chryseobacterium massiliense TaxID=204089 RepID=A0A3D9AFT2_9FLAO|nr:MULTISPECIES: hypothetical protein [Chryseobacterium]REC40031.1 hypothetical protein DRF68_20585 [Candidatus Chryseobacterium massiliae]
MNSRILIFVLFFPLFPLFFNSCNNRPIDCSKSNIAIENRWYAYNGGIDFSKIKNNDDLIFICNRINQFSEGEEVRVAYSYGDIDIYLNNRKIQAIFTYKNGVVYRVGVGRYVYDEELTARILT